MRLVIDIQPFQTDSKNRGIGRYVKNLCKQILKNKKNHDIIFILNKYHNTNIEIISNELAEFIPKQSILFFEVPDFCEKKSVNKSIRDKGEQYEVILKLPFNPNAITLNNEVKIRLKKMGLAELYYNDIVLNNGFTETDLITIYREVHNERIVRIYFFINYFS